MILIVKRGVRGTLWFAMAAKLSSENRTVLVTGVGGGVGQSILKSLGEPEYRVIGADGEPLATGLFAGDRGYLIPYASRPDFVPRLVAICRQEGCRLVFPGLDVELPVLARAAETFRAAGATCVVSSPDVIDICDDKLLTSRFLTRVGLASPKTSSLTSPDVCREVGFPMILKPMRGGQRSIGVVVARDPAEFERHLPSIDITNYVGQELIRGDEYTCGSINFDGRCQGVIVMRRVLRDGDTYKAFVEPNAAIEQCVRTAADALAPFGACNFQLRVRDGVPYIFEINARCSGTTSLPHIGGFQRAEDDCRLPARRQTARIRDPTDQHPSVLEGAADRQRTHRADLIARVCRWQRRASLSTGARRVLVTGASGFVGGHVVRALLTAGFEVDAMVRQPPSKPQWDGVRLVSGDLDRPDGFAALVEECTAVVHLAAFLPPSWVDSAHADALVRRNGLATLRLAEAVLAAGVDRFVYVAAGNAYAPSAVRPTEESSLYPVARATLLSRQQGAWGILRRASPPDPRARCGHLSSHDAVRAGNAGRVRHWGIHGGGRTGRRTDAARWRRADLRSGLRQRCGAPDRRGAGTWRQRRLQCRSGEGLLPEGDCRRGRGPLSGEAGADRDPPT